MMKNMYKQAGARVNLPAKAKLYLENVGGKIDYFPGRGDGGGTPFAENSAKIINLIFEPFP